MVAACELIALSLGVVGLIGAAATTGLPMWKVTAFIQENIITMESRWEGLWMNCYRQASIRMQCKVYDSLLYLPPDLQAARGLMCCSLALSFLGLLTSIPGLRDVNCLPGQRRVKRLIVAVAGVMQIMAALCVIIPVSWTAHVIIQDFYNPLLLDAQRRELGDALYIGWVTAAFLFASGVVFISCRTAEDSDLDRFYKPVYATSTSTTMSQMHPFATPSSLTSLPQQPLLYPQQPSASTYSTVVVPTGGQPMIYSVPAARNSTHPSLMSAPPLPSHGVARQPSQHTPMMYGYGYPRNDTQSLVSQANSGMYI